MSASTLESQLLALLKGEHSSLTLSFNDDTGPNYLSVKEALDIGYFDHTDWISEEEKERSIQTNRVWTLHWYPDTPIGFIAKSASTLPALLDAVFKEEETTS